MKKEKQPLGVLMLDLEGPTLTAFECELLQRPSVGGLILFSRNFTDRSQLQDLIAAVGECDNELLIAVDQEGGRVQRFREGFLALPPPHAIGQLYQQDTERGLAVARQCAWAMAAEILQLGIDISFAPVLDLYSATSTVIKERAFASDVASVVALATSYIEGMHEAGMAATGKHFPGHGSVIADSHYQLPEDARTVNEIMTTDFAVFAACVNRLDAVMPAHVVYPAIDSVAAGYSSTWITQKLRIDLGFDGVVFSDDLSMAAAHSGGKVEQRAEMALAAGCDMVLVCNDRTSALSVADWLERQSFPKNGRISRMKASPAPEIEQLYSENKWLEASEVVTSLA